VHLLLDGEFGREGRTGEERCSRLGLIGRNLDRAYGPAPVRRVVGRRDMGGHSAALVSGTEDLEG
jgi:hypothetical protein